MQKLSKDHGITKLPNKNISWGDYYKLVRLGLHLDLDKSLIKESAHNNIENVRLLLLIGADIHTLDDRALTTASLNSSLEMVRLLLDEGANINIRNGQALTSAGINDDLEMLKSLLEYNPDPLMTEDALLWASIYNYIDLVRLLLEYGAPVTDDVIENVYNNEILDLLQRYR